MTNEACAPRAGEWPGGVNGPAARTRAGVAASGRTRWRPRELLCTAADVLGGDPVAPTLAIEAMRRALQFTTMCDVYRTSDYSDRSPYRRGIAIGALVDRDPCQRQRSRSQATGVARQEPGKVGGRDSDVSQA
jgi:hypothetical protein